MNEILPCPFCGSSNIHDLPNFDWVACEDCGAQIEDGEPSARVLWNKRHQVIPAQCVDPSEFKPLTMSDIRLMAGEGKLSAHDVLAAANAALRLRKNSDGRTDEAKAREVGSQRGTVSNPGSACSDECRPNHGPSDQAGMGSERSSPVRDLSTSQASVEGSEPVAWRWKVSPMQLNWQYSDAPPAKFPVYNLELLFAAPPSQAGMREALEQIAIVCTDNMDRDCDHRMALDFVRQIANSATEPGHSGQRKECVHEHIIDLNGKWHCQKCGKAMEGE
jgi:hypothetical protein